MKLPVWPDTETTAQLARRNRCTPAEIGPRIRTGVQDRSLRAVQRQAASCSWWEFGRARLA